MKIAAIQMACTPDPGRNLKKAIEMASLAAEKGARLVAFPEMFNLPWFPSSKSEDGFVFAQEVGGETISRMRDLARERGLVLVCPFFERDGEKCYNTAVIIESDGSIVGSYRKAHIPDVPLWEEKYYFKPGDAPFSVYDTSCGRIGVQISWDNFFPEGSRILGLKGAQLIIAPTSAAFASQDRWLKVLSANALTNGLFVLRVNRSGREERQSFYGESFCVNPFGELGGGVSGSGDTVMMADIDTSMVDEARRLLPFYHDRRPDLYSEISSNPTILHT